MIQVATTMRAAFQRAINTGHATQHNHSLVRSALHRRVGLVTRKTMWSIQRGKR